MAHSGFIADPEYARKSQNEIITGKWEFQDSITFDKVIRGTAIATYYADLAEYYEHDISEILPTGTLVKFGGTKEITKTDSNGHLFFGIISTKPGVILNTNDSEDFLPVALCGKVPCRVTGIVKKFDKLTTSKIKGVAKRKTFIDTLLGKPTIGVSLENKSIKTEKLIEIFVKAQV